MTKRRRKLPLDVAVEAYLAELGVAGRAQGTIALYRYLLTRASRRIGDGRDVGHIDRAELTLYLQWLRDRNVSQSYIGSNVKVIRAFFNWLLEHGYVTDNPLAGMKVSRRRRSPVMPFSGREVELLLGAVRSPLERAIVFLLLDTGLRRAELLSLNLAQLDFERGTLRVKGKGGEWRTEALNDAPKRAVLEYLNSRPQTDGLLWPEGFQIDQVRKLLDRLGERAGVARVHPHRFRHTWACGALRSGMDVLVVKTLGGWRSLQMVEYYVGMLESERALAEHRRHSLVG